MNVEHDPSEEPTVTSRFDFASSPKAWMRGVLFFALTLLPASAILTRRAQLRGVRIHVI